MKGSALAVVAAWFGAAIRPREKMGMRNLAITGLIASLATPALAAPLRLQVDYGVLIDALADETRADAAADALARAGADAFPPLRDALEGALRALASDTDHAASVQRCVGILGALERIPEHAATVAPLLTRAAQQLPIEHTDVVFHTLATIIPFRGGQSIQILTFSRWADDSRPCKYGGVEIPGSTGAAPAILRALLELDRASVRLDKGWRPNLSTARLTQMVESDELYAMETAFELLARKPVDEQLGVVPLLDSVLRSTRPLREVRRVVAADAIAIVRRGAARIIVALADTGDAVDRATMMTAWRQLLLHSDRTGERLAAIGKLRGWIGAASPSAMREFAADVVPVLEALAASAPPRVLAELVAVVSMLGSAARSATPMLETLMAHPDRQVAEAARQALRQR